MNMVFSCLNPSIDDVCQDRKFYQRKPTLSFKFGVGYICILDCIDDMIMLHEMTFEGLILDGDDKKLVRVAMVIRTLDCVQEFYTDTSTLRLPEDLLKFESAEGKYDNSKVRRDAST